MRAPCSRASSFGITGPICASESSNGRIVSPASQTPLTEPMLDCTEPHDLELTPRQVGSMERAGLVLYEKGFQPAVDDAVEQVAGRHALNVATVVPLEQLDGAPDPHIWLDPVLARRSMQLMAEQVMPRVNAALK